jgi:hypothetical protein
MLEKFFSAPKTLRRLRGGISGPHIDAFADNLERDTRQPARSDIFELPPISAVSFSGKAMF